MTPEDLDFTLQDVKAGDDMMVAWEKVKVRAKELDKKKEQDQMNKNMDEDLLVLAVVHRLCGGGSADDSRYRAYRSRPCDGSTRGNTYPRHHWR